MTATIIRRMRDGCQEMVVEGCAPRLGGLC